MTTSSSLARRPTTAERVLTLLAERGGAKGLTRAEIGRALSVPHGTVDRASSLCWNGGRHTRPTTGCPAAICRPAQPSRRAGTSPRRRCPTDVDAQVIARHLTYLRTRNLAPANIDERRRALLNLAAWAARPLLDLSPADLERWRSTALPGRNSGRSRNTLTSHIRGYYTWCHLVEEITADDRGRKLVHAQARARQGRPALAPPDRPHGARPCARRRPAAGASDALPGRLSGSPCGGDRRAAAGERARARRPAAPGRAGQGQQGAHPAVAAPGAH